MTYSGPEYWEVIYRLRAVGDFGDLIRKAAEAKAALEALKGAAIGEGAAEAKASLDAAAAHRVDVAAIGEERRALEQLAAAAKLSQVWTAWGGRSTPEAHLSDLERELNLQTLINRQEWLGFTSPQQAYAWRTNELNQRKQMNYAEWAGYQTADQYLSYLQKERSGLSDLNAVLLRRADVYKANTEAALAYANALAGTHKSAGQLSENIDLASVNQFQDALVGLPDVVTTKIVLDDADALGRLAQYEALLRGIPHDVSTHDVLTASYALGGVPLGQPAPKAEVIPVSYGGPYKDQFAAILAEVARLNELRAEIPVDFHIDPSEVAALHAKMGTLNVTEMVRQHLVPMAGGASGGGGGPPPVLPPAAAEPPDDAAGKWAALAAAEKAAAGEADAAAVKLAAVQAAAAGDAEGAAKLAYAYQQLSADSKDAEDASAALVPKLDQLNTSVQRLYGWWGLLRKEVTLFGGLFGSTALIGAVAGWHIALDGIIEALAILIPAVVTATAGLLGWGAAAYQSGQQVYNQMKNVLTVSSALNTTVPPLTGNFQQLVDAVRPQAFQLFGDALDLMNSKTGVFQRLVMQTGHVLDEFGARIVVDMQRGGSGLQKFFDTGEKALSGLGKLLVPLGGVFMNLIQATEKTHIAEDLLAVADVLAKLLNVITSINPTILAFVLGLHGLSLWGGLAVSAVSKLALGLVSMLGAAGPLNGVMSTLAARLGASDDQLVKLGTHAPAVKAVADAMGQGAADVAQFAVAAGKGDKSVQELAASTERGAGLFDKYGKGLAQAGQDAVNLAIAAGATESQVAKVASGFANAGAEGGLLASLLARLGGLAGLATLGLGALAAAAAVFAYKSLTARDASQQWIDSINKGLASQSLFTVIGKNIADLAAVTDKLSHSQGLNAQAVHELTGEQSQLSGNLQLALPRIGQVSKAYGTDMVGSLELLNLAGVKTSDLFTRQGIVWQTDLQMVKGLVDGYRAMGQQLGTVGSDLNVLLVSESDQIKSMTTLNQAWDTWLQTVAGGESSLVKVQQDFGGIQTAGQVAGASMTGLNKQSLDLRSAFIGMIPDAGKVLDAIRLQTATMEDGAKGGALLTRATRDLAAEMIPLAKNNTDARAAVVALAQEVDPSITSWQKLTRWVGHEGASGAALDLQKVMFTLATPVSNLAQDAAKLSNTLQGDLNPAMAKAEFDALGGQKAFSAFASDLTKFGPGSAATVAAGRQVAEILLSIDKNSSTARDQFVAWAKSMGLSTQQADQLWKKVSEGQRPLESMRQGLASSATASDKLANSGFFAQRGDTFRTNMRDMATFFTKTLPDAITGFARFMAGSWSQSFTGFMRDFGSPVARFFGTSLPGFFTSIPHAAASAWDSAYQGFERGLGSPVARFFSVTLPGFLTAIPRDVATAWDSAYQGFERNFGSPIAKVFTSTLPSYFGGLWHGFLTDFGNPLGHFITVLVPGFFAGIGKDIGQAFSRWWADQDKNWVTPFGRVFLSLIPGWLDGSDKNFKSSAGNWWKSVDSGLVQPAGHFFTATLPGWMASIGGFFTSDWSKSWSWFANNIIGGFSKLWNVQFPGWFSAVENFFTSSWNKAWAFFANTLIGGWSKLWNVQFPAWLNAVTSFFRDSWNKAWDFFANTLIGGWSKLWNTQFPNWLNATGSFFRSTWDKAWSFFANTLIGGWSKLWNTQFPGWLNATGSFFTRMWRGAWDFFANTLIGGWSRLFNVQFPNWLNDIGRFFSSTWRTVWRDFSTDVVGPMGRWFSSSLPNAIRTGFKDSINWVIDNVINKVINFIDNDILKHLPGSLHISTIGNVASGGDVGAAAGFAAGGPFARMGPGSVPGASAVDGTRIMAMGGEYMVRQPARMALEATFGRGFMNWLNQFDQHSGAGSRGTMASQQVRPGINYATGGLVNPIGPGLRPERVDMGVDYGGSGVLRAIGSGQITSVYNSGWPGGTFIDLRLNPTYGSGYWYYAEDISPSVRVGQGVSAGQVVGHATGGGSGIEVGWASGVGGQTEAAAQGQDKLGLAHGDPGAYPTAWGVAASNLIKSLGGPAGIIRGPIQGGTSGIGGAIAAIWQSVEGLLDSAGTGLGNLIKPLAGLVAGGAKDLLSLARKGAAAIFGAVWDHSVKPLVDVMPGDSIPGALAQGAAAEIRQGIVNFMTGQDQSAQSTAASSGGGGGNIGPVNGPADAGPGQAQNYALHRLGAFGWGSDQFKFLQELWTRESGWNRFARNPGSGAYGIPQALPPTKLPLAGQASGGSHASPQIDWGLGYIRSVYHSPQNAWAHELSAGWYPHGGVVGGDGASMMGSLFAGGGAIGGADPWDGAVMASGGLTDWSPLNTAVRAEMSAMGAMQAAHLPSRGPTAAQRSAFAAWQKALWSQQLKTIGLGRAGAYQALSSNASNPSKMTAGQWSAFTGDLTTLLKEEEGTGIPGGINPPGTPANSGHVAWQYLRPQWQGLLDRLRIVQQRAGAAQTQWGSQFSLSPVGSGPSGSGQPGTTGQTGTDSPEWDAASAALNTAVRTEIDKFWPFMGTTLPKGATSSQQKDWVAWRNALEKQQYKTIGLGHSGAYQAISDRLAAPATITAGQWSTFISDVNYLLREEEGTGAGGINPPGTPSNSGWPGYHYHPLYWKDLRKDLQNVVAKANTARNVWSTLYGPGHVPGTPGPPVTPGAGRPPGSGTGPSGLVNVMPEATMGGPSHPVFGGSGTPDMGFAAGGGLDQVAGMFSGGLNPGGVMIPVVVRHGIPDSALRQLSGVSGSSGTGRDFPRRLSEAGGSHFGPALNVEQLNINNPLPQRPSESIAHAAGRMAFLAGRMS